VADLVTEVREPVDNRVVAASTLYEIGNVAESQTTVPGLLEVLTNPREDEDVRRHVLWALSVHGSALANIKGVMPAFGRVLSEPPREENLLVRFNCAYVMGMVLQEKTPPEVFPVLLDYLKTDRIRIFRTKGTRVQGGGLETTTGGTTSIDLREGDGRSMAVSALERIGPAVVRQHPEIVDQLRRLAADESGFASFREQCRDFLVDLGQP